MKDKLLIGLLAGLLIPFVGYYLITGLLAIVALFLQGTDMMVLLRPSTHYLLSIAWNIIAVNMANRRYMTRTVQGIVFATLIYSGIWLWKFYSMVF